MKNKIMKFWAYNKKVSVMCLDTTKLVEDLKNIHDLTPTSTAALGRVATVATMMAHLEIKELTDSFTIQIKGDGELGSMVAIVNLENNKKANIKAYVQNPHVELPLNQFGKIDVGGAVGRTGYINVIKQNDVTKANYNGLIPLVSGEIAEDFTEYFVKSKQTPTALALGVLVDKNGVKKAGGYIINPMPDATENDITKIEDALFIADSISVMLDDGLSLEEIAKKVTGDENVEIIEEDLQVEYKCLCSKKKFERGLISLGKDELIDILNEDEKIDTECHFCHKKYHFTKEEIQDLINSISVNSDLK